MSLSIKKQFKELIIGDLDSDEVDITIFGSDGGEYTISLDKEDRLQLINYLSSLTKPLNVQDSVNYTPKFDDLGAPPKSPSGIQDINFVSFNGVLTDPSKCAPHYCAKRTSGILDCDNGKCIFD